MIKSNVFVLILSRLTCIIVVFFQMIIIQQDFSEDIRGFLASAFSKANSPNSMRKKTKTKTC